LVIVPAAFDSVSKFWVTADPGTGRLTQPAASALGGVASVVATMDTSATYRATAVTKNLSQDWHRGCIVC
jgi:hypothetical protein